METTLKTKLTEAFCPHRLDIRDQSHKHAGHAEAQAHGGSHFDVVLVSDKFEGLGKIQRHRLVYDALRDEMAPGGVHALQMKLYTPQEWEQQGT